jgi:predicted Zn-dependent protease with MMP-like domain
MRFPRLLTIATKVVKDTLLSLPSEIRNEALDCRIELTEMDALVDIDEDLDPDLLGLFEGNARCDPQPESPEEMPRIRLFLDNLWDECAGDLTTYRHEVRITFLHELGHYLGLDEDEVAALGLE